MPEGDSVYRAAARLREALVGKVITRSDFRVPRYATADLSGRTTLEVVSRGKHLLIRLGPADDPDARTREHATPLTLHTHLRMDGTWRILPTPGSGTPTTTAHTTPADASTTTDPASPLAGGAPVPDPAATPPHDDSSGPGTTSGSGTVVAHPGSIAPGTTADSADLRTAGNAGPGSETAQTGSTGPGAAATPTPGPRTATHPSPTPAARTATGPAPRKSAGSGPAGPAYEIRVILATADLTAVGYRLPVVELLRTSEEHRAVGHLGPDLLGPDWDEDLAAANLLADPARPLGEALLDQRNLAGIGNIYKSELCFLAGLTPWTPVGDIPKAAATLPRIAAAAHRLLDANKDRHRNTTGSRRRGQDLFVYGRVRRPCLRCGTPVREAPQDGRPTYWCPHCQSGPTP
ncbi:Formamidopyrimidine-DNA glycosylase [Streptomyces avidinii]